jgi:RNA helicase HrpA
MDMATLPVYQQKDRILGALEQHQVVVVESPTGSGKTTQLPIILHEAGYDGRGMLGITQPRRIAAVSVAEFIGRQLGSQLPGLVGYKMRFDDQTKPETRLKILTDGMLLQEMKADYLLSNYSLIMVDEAHERSLNIDFILGLLKRVLEQRPEFRVIVSSATINAEVFSAFFGNCPVVRIDSEMYPVEIRYDPPRVESSPDDLILKIVENVVKAVNSGRPGDILVFLSGEKLIKDCIQNLIDSEVRSKLDIRPLYGRLSKEEQDRVFPAPPEGKTKVVVSTNIAETSITIDGITTVVDSGLAKLSYYNPRNYTESLIEGPISRASADQRRGRAGRTRPGVCVRLYTKEDYQARPLFTTEEIYRTDLSEVVLRMAELGIYDFDRFDFISPPGRGALAAGVETLRLLDALTPDNRLSEIGTMMARFPLLPRHSRILVEAIRSFPEVTEECIVATAFLTSNTPFLLPQGEEIEARRAHHSFRDKHGDFVSYLRLYAGYRSAKRKEEFCERHYLDSRVTGEIHNIKQQLEQIVSDMGVPISHGGSVADYLTALSKGLIQFVCRRSGRDTYRSLTADRIQIHPGSVLFRETPDFIVAGEIVRTSRTYARSVSPLEKSWLSRISPELAENLVERSASREKKKSERDTTWEIRLGRHSFALEPYKGKKKLAVLDWEKLRSAARELGFELPPRYASLRGKLVYKRQEILKGERLSTIWDVMRHIDPSRDIRSSFPRKRSYAGSDQARELSTNVDYTLKLAPLKKSSSTLGFVSLQTDGNGEYWFKPIKDFYRAVSESLSSLEAFADEMPDDAPDRQIERVGAAYRRLARIIEEDSR